MLILLRLLLCYFLIGQASLQAHPTTHPVQRLVSLPCASASGKCNIGSGFAYALRDNTLLLFTTIGYANIDQELPFTENTQFYIGSLKKQFIATAILILVNEGKLNLHAPISKYLSLPTHLPAQHPSWPHLTTIHHLLTHCSGVLDSAVKQAPQSTPLPFLHRAFQNASPPLYRFEYSTAAYNLLEHIIEAVTGISFGEYIQQHILRPMGLHNTLFHSSGTPEDIRSKLCKNLCSVYYFNSLDNNLRACYLESEFRAFSNFEMVSTAHDLVKWSAALHSGKVFQTSKEKSDQLLTIMRGLYTHSPEENSYYGYGIKTYQGKNHISFWHEGLVTGTSVYLEYIPKTNTHILVFSNTGNNPFNAKTGQYILHLATQHSHKNN